MELITILKEVRDPAVFLFCVAIVFYLNRNYVSKEIYRENFEALRKEIEAIRDDYVSKEKLTDVLKPVEDHLKSIGREIGELKKFIVEVLKK